MTIDVYSMTGTKKGTMDLPALFESTINWGLMHQAVVLQQSNRRQSPAHVKTRGEVQGSTRKLFAQKHTGRARRGAVRSPLLRGGGKTFGPRNDQNYVKDMPRKMRQAALRSCLSMQASKHAILGLEEYSDTIKTKDFAALLKKLPVEYGRPILLVTDGAHRALALSARNVPSVKTVRASYLNAEDVIHARHVIFLVPALAAVEKHLGKVEKEKDGSSDGSEPKTPRTKKAPAKKAVSKKKTSPSA